MNCLDQCTFIMQGINGKGSIRFPGRQEPKGLLNSASVNGLGNSPSVNPQAQANRELPWCAHKGRRRLDESVIQL